jgi:hypothetical protein
MGVLMSFHSEDTGFCRAYYTTCNKYNQKILYCVQEEFTNVFVIYRCTKDGEPNYEVQPDPAIVQFEPSQNVAYDTFLKAKKLLLC